MQLLQSMLMGFGAVLAVTWWWSVPLVIVWIIAVFPMPGRGPNSTVRDEWRGFKFGPRAAAFERAGGRCEAPLVLVWGRCSSPATEVDHVFPHSKGGPTIASNGQALCKAHNREKAAKNPRWWYVLGLERRRRSYFPAGVDVRVRAVMTQGDEQARAASAARRARKGPRPEVPAAS